MSIWSHQDLDVPNRKPPGSYYRTQYTIRGCIPTLLTLRTGYIHLHPHFSYYGIYLTFRPGCKSQQGLLILHFTSRAEHLGLRNPPFVLLSVTLLLRAPFTHFSPRTLVRALSLDVLIASIYILLSTVPFAFVTFQTLPMFSIFVLFPRIWSRLFWFTLICFKYPFVLDPHLIRGRQFYFARGHHYHTLTAILTPLSFLSKGMGLYRVYSLLQPKNHWNMINRNINV